ncbi:MAG TPA: hypothetical protein VHD87_12710 [Acidimicrobiales bacterium]|nr:hypothetical protein [Acidimicrobiales bacterium]
MSDTAPATFRSEGEQIAERRYVAGEYGVPEESVIVLPLANTPPLVIPPVGHHGLGKLPATLNVAFAGDPVFWLDAPTRVRADGEDDIAFGYRLWLELIDRGFLDEASGRRRSALAVAGLDINSQEVRARLTAYRDGLADPLFNELEIPRANLTMEEAFELAATLAESTQAALGELETHALRQRMPDLHTLADDVEAAPGVLADRLAELRDAAAAGRQWVGPIEAEDLPRLRLAMSDVFDVVQQAIADFADLQSIPMLVTLPSTERAAHREACLRETQAAVDAVAEHAAALLQQVERNGGQADDVEALCAYLTDTVMQLTAATVAEAS